MATGLQKCLLSDDAVIITLVCVQDALKWLNSFREVTLLMLQRKKSCASKWLAGNFVYSDVRNTACYLGYIQWSAWGTRQCSLVVLIRNRTIRANYVAVILNAPSWLCSVLCYRGYKRARAQQAPLWRGFESGAAAAERKKEGTGSCIIQIFWLSPILVLKTPDCSFKQWRKVMLGAMVVVLCYLIADDI